MAISGKVGAVYVSDINTAPVSFTDQATIKDATLTRYQVTNATYRYWPLDAVITVKKNGAVITTGFSLERAGGYVVFDAALQASDVVLVSGTALTLVQRGGFFNWSVDTDSEVPEITTFASAGWKEYAQVLNGWSGSADAYWGDTFFYDAIDAGNTIVVKLFIDSGAAQTCLEGFALINGDSIEGPVDGIVSETIDFEGVGSLYPRF